MRLRLSSTVPLLLSLACPLVNAIAVSQATTNPFGTKRSLPSVNFNTGVLTLNPLFLIDSIPTTRTFNFVVSLVNGAPDGVQREMLVINGQFPGPLIEANAGDTIVVNVQNNLPTGTGIHWHGMNQKGSNWADGVPGISQCPIPAGTSFTYKFTIASDQYGTYWYHSHMGNTMADGLIGPLIVHSPNEPIVRGVDYLYDQIVLLGDWMHDLSDVIVGALSTPPGIYRGSQFAPAPDALLLNNRGSYYACATTSGCVDPGLQSVKVVAGAKTRIRLINHSSHVNYKFSIDNHPLTVVAADGIPIVPLAGVHQVPIGLAQRYDLILNANVGNVGSSYTIRASMCSASIANIPSGFVNTNTAALRYTSALLGLGAGTSTPTSTDWSDSTYNDAMCSDFADNQLVPYAKSAVPSNALDNTFMSSAAGFIAAGNGTLSKFTFNGVSWTNYIYEPLLLTLHSGRSINSSAIANHIFTGNGGGDIVVNNLDTFLDHPYHLHGNSFYIVARGPGPLDAAGYAALTFNTVNPPNRDTVIVPRGNFAVLRIITDNAGVWPLHCHIGWHLAVGKMAAIIVQPNAISQQTIPAAATALCNACELPSGDSVNTVAPGKRTLPAPEKRAHVSYGIPSSEMHRSRASHHRHRHSDRKRIHSFDVEERMEIDALEPADFALGARSAIAGVANLDVTVTDLDNELKNVIDELTGAETSSSIAATSCKRRYESMD